MGIAPSEVLSLSLHDYQAACFHWSQSQTGEEDDEDPLSSGDFDAMLVSLHSEALH